MTPISASENTSSSGPLWFQRVNPLAGRRVSDPDLRRRLAELCETERALVTAAEECSDELYELIGGATELDRRRLVDLRRAIHNGRTPRHVPDPPPASVARWSTLHENKVRLTEEIAATYDGAAHRERSTLVELLADEDFRRSLALAAPEIHDEAERYRRAFAESERLPARIRKSERGLLQYVTRAMVRTSPLSRFTAVGIAEPDPEGIRPDVADPAGATAFPGLDRSMLAYVLGGRPSEEGGAGTIDRTDVWVGLAPTSYLDAQDGKLYFLRETPEGLTRSSITLSPPLGILLDALSMGRRTPRALAEEVCAQSGWPDEKAQNLIATALRSGVLCTFATAEDATIDLDDLLRIPDTAQDTRLADIRDRLPRIAECSPTERGGELRSLRAALGEASRHARRPAQIDVVEDYVLPPSRISPSSWRPMLDDLGSATDLLTVFDWLHDVRAYLTAAFVQRYGAGASARLTECAPYLVGEVTRRAGVAAEAYAPSGDGDGAVLDELGPEDGCLRRMFELRRTVTEYVRTRLSKTAAEGEATLTLSPTEVEQLTRDMPERFRRHPMLYGTLVQQSGDRLMLNDGLPGHGMLYGRYLFADQSLGGNATARLAERLQRVYGADGSRVVEDRGLYGLNVNAHPRVLPDGLQVDDWYTLRLRHDRDTDELVVEDPDGVPLRVLPLGAGHPGLYPPPLSVASGLVMSGRLYSGLAQGWHTATPWDGRSTRACPGISVGHVVVDRRRWYGGEELATALSAGPEDHDRLRALTAWRGRHGIPEEAVVKSAPEDGPLAVSAPNAQERRLRQKPQYVDFGSALSTRVLPRMLERRADGDNGTEDFLEEALPGVVDGTHATEWVVEVGRGSGERFRYGGGVQEGGSVCD